MVNLENFSLAEMQQLLKDLPIEIQRRQTTERKAVVAEMKALAEARGFSFDELVGAPSNTSGSTGKQRKPVAIKYRHPENSAFTWTGRGRKPAWVVEWESAGKPIDLLKISP